VTDPQVIWRRLTVHFARSVSFPTRNRAVMQVMVFALSGPSSPTAGLTFVNPAGVQEVVLAHRTIRSTAPASPTTAPDTACSSASRMLRPSDPMPVKEVLAMTTSLFIDGSSCAALLASVLLGAGVASAGEPR
jgi:hypothetical protein